MGGDKPRRELRGRRLIDPVLDLAFRLSDDVLVADGSEALELPEGARRIADQVGAPGPAGGLLAGLAAARHPWCLLLAADQPEPSEAVVAELAARRRLGCQAVIVVDGAYRQPFHGLWARAALAPLQARLASGGASMRSLLSALDVVEVPADELDRLDATRRYLIDLDTPEDLAAARRDRPS